MMINSMRTKLLDEAGEFLSEAGLKKLKGEGL